LKKFEKFLVWSLFVLVDTPAINTYRKSPAKCILCLQGFFLTAKKSKIRTLNFVEMKRGSFFGSLVSGRKENFRQKKGFWLRSFNSFWGGLKVKYFNIDGLSSHGWNTDFFD